MPIDENDENALVTALHARLKSVLAGDPAKEYVMARTYCERIQELFAMREREEWTAKKQ